MSVFTRLANIAKPYRGTLYTGLGLVAVTTVLEDFLVPLLFMSLLYTVIGGEMFHERGFTLTLDFHDLKIDLETPLRAFVGSSDPFKLLIALAALTGLVVFFKCLFESRQGYLMNKFANLMTRDIRQRLFGQLIRLSPTHLESEKTGAHLSRITGDVVVLQQCLGPQLAGVIQAPLGVVVSLCGMFVFGWKLMVVALVLAPLIGFTIGIGGRKIRKLSVRIQERLAELNGYLVERLSNVRIIQSFVREPFEMEKVAGHNNQYYRDSMRSVQVTEILAPGIEMIAYLGMLVGVLIGGVAVFAGDMDPLSFMVFIALAQRAGTKFKQLSRINQIRQQASGAAERIFSVLDIVPDITDAPDAQPLPPVQGRIVFDHVNFCYTPGEPILSDIHLDVAPGEVIALVGPSGAGKTTLVNLLPRFYDPTEGAIRIEGMDLREVTLDSLRSQVGSVPQETQLFSGTIYENILYGKLDASETEVLEAARAANALEFIEKLPDGFNTVVGERGARLSGGQRQRVAIARALLKNPRILILDEATSALDSESEHLVQQALERLMQNRTTFVIAHRLSTVQHATRILVLERGRIVEMGAHQQLLAQGHLYQRLYDMQFRNAPTPAATE